MMSWGRDKSAQSVSDAGQLLRATSITTTHFLQDTGCVAFPFVDVHPQTIAATLAVSSVPEAVTQAVVVILEVWPESHWPGFALLQVDVLQSYTA